MPLAEIGGGSLRKSAIWTICVVVIFGGYVATLLSLRTSLGVLRSNQESLLAKFDSTNSEIDELEVRLMLLDATLQERIAQLESTIQEAASASDTVSTLPSVPEQAAETVEPADWPFLLASDLPEHFQGRFSTLDLFLDVGSGGIARLNFPGGFDPYADPASRRVAEKLLLAFLDRHDYMQGEIARRLTTQKFDSYDDPAEVNRRCEELKSNGQAPSVQELPAGGWAVVDITGISDSASYKKYSADIRDLPDVIGVDGAYFAVYPADFHFRE